MTLFKPCSNKTNLKGFALGWNYFYSWAITLPGEHTTGSCATSRLTYLPF